MKWLIGCLLALVMVTAGFAGEDPYIAIVGNDAIVGIGDGVANPFYFSAKHQQFLYDQTLFDVEVCYPGFQPTTVTPQTRVGGPGCEQFRSNTPINQPEVCDTAGTVLGVGDFIFFGEPNARITAGNAGYYEWWIRLPKKPSGEINICIQCGILKPNSFAFEEFNAVNLCAAETGERIGAGLCVRQEVDAGQNPLLVGALPRITAIAYPGPYSLGFTAFNLTAFRNPGPYALTGETATQVLDGSNPNTRILLKSCLDKCIVARLPVTGQAITGTTVTESDLEAGDLIYVRMDVPRANSVDIYCHSQSAKIAGIGEAPF
jgi:hypothetical protein